MVSSLAEVALSHHRIISVDLVPDSCNSKAQPGNISVSACVLPPGLELLGLANRSHVLCCSVPQSKILLFAILLVATRCNSKCAAPYLK